MPVSPTIQFIYNVKGVQADAAALLKEQFPAITVTSVGQTGQLVLSGQKNQIDTALELLGKVDKPLQAQSGPDVQQVIYAAKGKPEDIVALIAAQFPALKATPVGSTSQLILSGPKPQLDAALELLGKVDKPLPVQVTVTPEVQQQQVYTAKGKPEDVASLIAAQFPALKVTLVGATEQLILSGPKLQLDTAVALLKQVDRAPSVQANPAVRQQVYAVKGDQKDIAALLAAQFPALKITPVGTTGQLVLNGTQDLLDAAVNCSAAWTKRWRAARRCSSGSFSWSMPAPRNSRRCSTTPCKRPSRRRAVRRPPCRTCRSAAWTPAAIPR